jgi:hypothetical protein
VHDVFKTYKMRMPAALLGWCSRQRFGYPQDTDGMPLP